VHCVAFGCALTRDFDVSVVVHALLAIEHGPHMVTRMAGDFVREGYDTVSHVSIVTDTERRLEDKEIVFVAPHDERFERRSRTSR